MRIKDRECGFVFSYQAFSVGKAHDVPAILVSLSITSHLLRYYSLRLRYMARAQNNCNFTFKSTCQLTAVTKAFPRCKGHRNMFTSLLDFLTVVAVALFFTWIDEEDEKSEILSPNLAAVPSPSICLRTAPPTSLTLQVE